LNDASRSSPAFAGVAIEWAKKQPTIPKKEEGEEEETDDDHRRSMQQETIVTAAMIAARDGGSELVATHEAWIRDTFVRALNGKYDPVHRVRAGLQFNPMAIAFAGMVLLLKNRFNIDDVHTLLQSAGNDNPAATHGLAASAELLSEIDERLPRSVLRCAFAACTKPRRNWRQPESEHTACVERRRQEVAKAIDTELAWLIGKQEEPGWPQFTPDPARPRQRFTRAPGNTRRNIHEDHVEPDVYTDHQAAALWLGSAASLFDVNKRPWLLDIVKMYGASTYIANGSELEDDDDTDHRPTEWNSSFFKLLAYCLPGLTSAQIDETVILPITHLPDQAFFDVMTSFLREVDAVYFNDYALQDTFAVQIRSAFAKKIMTTRAWNRHVRDHSTSTELHFGPAIATVFFNDYWGFQPPKCYLYPKGIDRLDPFLPLLTEVAETGQFFLPVITLLNLLEVAPRGSHLPVVVAAGKTWLATHPDSKEFWLDQGIGRRLCSLLQAIFATNPTMFGLNQPLRKDIDGLLASLVRMGVAEANRVEENLFSAAQTEAETA